MGRPYVLMQPDIEGIKLIQGFEQCRLTAYMPIAKDKPTIGWGSTGPDIHIGLTWTQAQCDARFVQDLNRFAVSVSQLITGHPTTENQFDALVSLAYNIGTHALSISTLLRDHNAGNYVATADQFLLWNHQAGMILAGLTRRRQAERSLYLRR